MLEEWRDIEDYEGLYQVSNFGRIKRMRFINNMYNFPQERIMKKSLKTNGYEIVRLSKRGVKTTFMVHRLVAKAFIDNPSDYLEINHIDGNKTNNSVENLEWCSRSQNELHAWKNGLKKYTELMKINLNKLNQRKKVKNVRN